MPEFSADVLFDKISRFGVIVCIRLWNQNFESVDYLRPPLNRKLSLALSLTDLTPRLCTSKIYFLHEFFRFPINRDINLRQLHAIAGYQFAFCFKTRMTAKILPALFLVTFFFARSSSQRLSIINGQKVDIKSVPYQCVLQYQGRFFCGASILSKCFALTAGKYLIATNV